MLSADVRGEWQADGEVGTHLPRQGLVDSRHVYGRIGVLVFLGLGADV